MEQRHRLAQAGRAERILAARRRQRGWLPLVDERGGHRTDKPLLTGSQVAWPRFAIRCQRGKGTILSTLIRLLKDARGVTSLEYAFIVVWIGAGLVIGLGVLGDNLSATYDDIAVQIKTATGPN